MTKLELKFRKALTTAMVALNYYANISRHDEHDKDVILVGTCKRCEHDMNPQSMAKTAIDEIKSLDI
jgi:hypothetical protein